MNSQQPAQPPEDNRPNKDWLQLWYQLAHSDLQWAKGQGWNALQWSILLLAAVFTASRQFTTIVPGVWVTLTIAIAAVSAWWQIDLHIFARNTRETSEKLVAPLRQRDELLPRRSADPHHVKLLVVRLAITIAAATITVIEVVP